MQLLSTRLHLLLYRYFCLNISKDNRRPRFISRAMTWPAKPIMVTGSKSRPLTDTMNTDFQKFGIFGKYLSRGEMNAKSYGHNSPKELTCGKPAMSGCKLWCVCGRGGHCFIYKDSRYGHSNCMAYLQASTWNRCTEPSGLQASYVCALLQTLC